MQYLFNAEFENPSIIYCSILALHLVKKNFSKIYTEYGTEILTLNEYQNLIAFVSYFECGNNL